ncbi:MAG: hypothetical protein U5N58_06630 [Actinomycetota bacterium]|nr:hypothetical protein [Actinomycetota bacterium]
MSKVSASVNFDDYGLTSSTNVLYEWNGTHRWSDYYYDYDMYQRYPNYQRFIIPITGFSGGASKEWRTSGSITVKKVEVNGGGQDYNFQLSGPTSKSPKDLADGEQGTWSSLAWGTYTVTEILSNSCYTTTYKVYDNP